MTIADAFKEFFFKLNGTRPSGNNIADVVRNGAASVQQNNESALTTRVEALEALLPIVYEDDTDKSFVLNSSTADSTKQFRITVVDDGTITATEIVAPGPQ